MATGHEHSTHNPEVSLPGPASPATVAEGNGQQKKNTPEQLKKCLHEWLGISSDSPSHYKLLGIDDFESNPTVISNAADQRMAFLRTFQGGPNSDVCISLLNLMSRIRVKLLHPDRKEEYDTSLSRKQRVSAETQSTNQRLVNASATDTALGHKSDTDPDIAKTLQSEEPPAVPMKKSTNGKRPVPRAREVVPPAILQTEQQLEKSAIQQIAVAALDANPVTRHATRPQKNSAIDNVVTWAKTNKVTASVAGIGAASVLFTTILLATIAGGKKESEETATPAKPNVADVAKAENTQQVFPIASPVVEDTALEEPKEVIAEPTEPDPKEEFVVAQNPAVAAVLPDRTAVRIDPEVAAKEKAEALAKAAEAARRTFNSDSWKKYKEFKERFSSQGLDALIAAAQSEQDPATRAGIAFVAVDRAVATGELEKFNTAMAIVTTQSARHGYNGMRADDALTVEEHILDEGTLSRFDAKERFALMQRLVDQTWIAYEYGNYPLAEKLLERATEAAVGLSASGIATSRSTADRSAAAKRLAAVRRAVIDARARTRNFAALDNAADQGDKTADAMLDILQDGDWKSAVDLLAQSDNPDVARAADMDSASPQNATELLNAAMAWQTAATSDKKNTAHWNNRAAALLTQAKSAATAARIHGAAALEFNRSATALATTLTSAGASLGGPMGTQGYVEGRDEVDEVETEINITSTPAERARAEFTKLTGIHAMEPDMRNAQEAQLHRQGYIKVDLAAYRESLPRGWRILNGNAWALNNGGHLDISNGDLGDRDIQIVIKADNEVSLHLPTTTDNGSTAKGVWAIFRGWKNTGHHIILPNVDYSKLPTATGNSRIAPGTPAYLNASTRHGSTRGASTTTIRLQVGDQRNTGATESVTLPTNNVNYRNDNYPESDSIALWNNSSDNVTVDAIYVKVSSKK